MYIVRASLLTIAHSHTLGERVGLLVVTCIWRKMISVCSVHVFCSVLLIFKDHRGRVLPQRLRKTVSARVLYNFNRLKTDVAVITYPILQGPATAGRNRNVFSYSKRVPKRVCFTGNSIEKCLRCAHFLRLHTTEYALRTIPSLEETRTKSQKCGKRCSEFAIDS